MPDVIRRLLATLMTLGMLLTTAACQASVGEDGAEVEAGDEGEEEGDD
jgi:hypothetical protein